MSILRVANLQFNASGTRRIDYDAVADDGIVKISAAAVKLPVGDTASRPNSTAGMIRYNSDTGYMEFGGASNWVAVASNVAFDVANAAFASANNVAPQVTPAFLTANLAYTTTNSAYDFANSAYASINSNWTVTNTIYGVANTALRNSDITLSGSLITTGGMYAQGKISGGIGNGLANGVYIGTQSTYGTIEIVGQTGGLIDFSKTGADYFGRILYDNASNTMSIGATSNVTFNIAGSERMRIDSTGKVGIGTTSPVGQLTIAAANTVGGVGYADFLRVTNNSYPAVTNPVKTFRLNQTGGIEIINDAYSAVIFTLDNNGILATAARGITSSSMPAGSILQVQQTVKSDTFVSSSTAWVDVTGMSVNITPTSSTSKILVSFAIHGTTPNVAYVKLLRNGSDIAIGDAASNRIRCTAGNFNVGGDGNTTYLFTHEFLDSPGTTSTLTYKLQFRHESGGSNWHVNRTVNDPDSATGMRGISSITVKEIAQ